MKKIYLILIVLLVVPFVLADDVSVWQGQYYTGTTFNTGTYEFNFTVYDAKVGAGSVCYSNRTTLTTGSWGEWKTEQFGVGAVCNNASKDYFLDLRINNETQGERRRLTSFPYLRKDTDTVIEGNLVIDKNITTATGFFSYLGSLANRITKIWVQDIDVSGNVNASNYTLSGTTITSWSDISSSDSDLTNYALKNQSETFTGNITTTQTGFFGWLGSLNSRITKLWIVDINATGNIETSQNISAQYFKGNGALLTNISAGSGLAPVYLGSNLTATNAGDTTVFTIALTPNKINIIQAYLAQSSSTAGVAIQNRATISESGPIGYCNFATQTQPATEVVDNIVVSTTSSDTGTTSMGLDTNVPFINKVICTIIADAGQKNLIILFNSETTATVTTYAGSYYTNAVN